MQVLWGVLTAAIGVFLFVCGSTRSEFVVYRLLAARAKLLWGDRVHSFLQVVGILVALFGIAMALGYIPVRERLD